MVRCASHWDRDRGVCVGALRYNWTDDVADAIVESMWAPWPGYAVDPRNWSLLLDADGPENVKVSMRPLDRPVAYLCD